MLAAILLKQKCSKSRPILLVLPWARTFFTNTQYRNEKRALSRLLRDLGTLFKRNTHCEAFFKDGIYRSFQF